MVTQQPLTPALSPLGGERGQRVAVIHDWLTGMRGGEAVLEGILDVLPQAEIFTLFHFPGSVSAKIESHPIHTSDIQNLARRISDYRRLLPLYPRAVRKWDLSRFDLIVSSSHCVAKGIDPKGKPHLCYCHTPMRYIWDRFDDYFPRTRLLQRAAAASVAPWLRKWDVATAREVTQFAANSSFVADRIRRYYGREAEVIHPFVGEAFLRAPLAHDRDDYHLIVSALVPYKRIDVAIDAAVASGKRLVIIGGGPLFDELRQRGRTSVELLGSVPTAVIIERLARARSLILPGVEDFGITPLEAMAMGTPVVALGEGGVLDSVLPGRTGIFFDRPEVDSLRHALAEVEARQWDREFLRAHAGTFSRERFQAKLAAAIQRLIG